MFVFCRDRLLHDFVAALTNSTITSAFDRQAAEVYKDTCSNLNESE